MDQPTLEPARTARASRQLCILKQLFILLFLVSTSPRVRTAATEAGGVVLAWGNNEWGQTSVPLAAQSGVVAIAAGRDYSVAVKSDGTVVAWGYNGSGQVTGTPTAESASATPVTLGGQILSGVTAIAAGGSHTVALKNDGTVVAWGNNDSGQVTGAPPTNATWSATASPVTLGRQVLSGVTAIAAGSRHSVALKKDGSVVAWGDPDQVPVTAQSGVTAIAAGDANTVALKKDG
jgi:alpha-tubulin suppressor-like RCC1 family protein